MFDTWGEVGFVGMNSDEAHDGNGQAKKAEA